MIDIFFFCSMESTKSRYMEIDIVFSPRLSYLKTDSGWVRNRGGLGPGTSQLVTSKQEPRSTYFANKTNTNDRH